MVRGLFISAIFALGIFVGCSQPDGTTASIVPEYTEVPAGVDTTIGTDRDFPVPRVADTKPTNNPVLSAPRVMDTTTINDPVPPTPTVVERAVAVDSDSSVVRPGARRAPRQGRGFVPLDNPTFLAAVDTKFFSDEDLVLGVEFAGEVRAYPVRMLRYHHIVNDTVRGRPLLVTY